MVVKNWCKGKNTVLRVSSCWNDFFVLEDTESLTDKRWDTWNKAPYMLLTDIGSEKILKALSTENEVVLNSPQHLYSLLGNFDLNLKMTYDNFDAIEHALKRKLVFFMKKSYSRERGSIYHKIHKGKNEYPTLCIIVASRK